MASNFTKELYGKDRNLANRDKYKKRSSYAGTVCHYTKQFGLIVGKIWLQCLRYTFRFDYSSELRLIDKYPLCFLKKIPEIPSN